MKKIMILIFLTLVTVLMFMRPTYAEETAVYPVGKNYLDLQDMRILDDAPDFIETLNHLRVKPNIWYTLVLDYKFLGLHASYPEFLEVFFEDGFGEEYYYQGLIDDTSQKRVYLEFMPLSDWIKFHSIPIGKTDNYDVILYEGLYSEFTGYEPFICETEKMQYEGILPMDYDALLTAEQIKGLIESKDPYGGILDYIVETDEYSSSLKKPGSYEMVFVSTFNQITKKYFLDIKVFDLTSPVISLTESIEVQLGNKITIEEIKQLITVTDNVDEMTSSDLIVIQDTYSEATSVGNYSITVEATDTSGNASNLEIPIQLVDLIGPVITGPSDIYLYTTDEPMSNQHILNMFVARDDVDGPNVTFEITTNDYNQQTAPGAYRIILRGGDTQYNFTFKYIDIHVVENRGPIFVEDETILLASSAENMSEQDIIDWFKNLSQLHGLGASQVEVVYNEYEGNEKLGGSYYVYLNYEMNGQLQTSRIRIDVEEETKNLNYLMLGSLGGVIALGVLSFFIIKKKKI